MRRFALVGAVILLVAAAVSAYSALFTVHQTQQALVLRFGEIIRDPITDPGLHTKWPFVEEALFLDKRILDLDSPAQEVIAADQKRLVVDAFARYKITDALRFYQAVTGNQATGDSRLSTLLNSAVRRVLGDATFEDIVRDDRPELMRRITSQVNAQAQNLGVTIVDVRIRRADLPEANSQAVYQRMQTEREREARDIRARGEEESQRIRSRADREARVIEAEANREAEVIRGEGDAERNRLYADAYGRDAEFFAFYRSMQAYEQGLAASDTRLVVSPNTEFFRYFEDSLGGAVDAPSPVQGGGANALDREPESPQAGAELPAPVPGDALPPSNGAAVSDTPEQ